MGSNNRRLREAVAHRQGYTYVCCWCGHWIHPAQRTLEHVLPISRGGTNDPDNLRIACRACNQGRGNHYDPRVFMFN